MKLKRLISCGLVGILTGVGILMNAKVSSAEDKSVKYTIASSASVTASGQVIEGSNASFKNTYSTKEQITKDNSMTFKLTNIDGIKVSKIVMKTHTNKSKGAGTIKIDIGEGNLYSGNYIKSFSTSYSDYEFDVKALKNVDYMFGDISIVMSCTVNSLYCQSYTIYYFEGEPTKSYPVTFYDGEAELTDLACNVEENGKITKPADPVKEGYIFDAWYKESTFDNKWDFENDIVAADTKLYAKFLPEAEVTKYNVTFKSDENTVINTVTVKEGNSVGEPENPVKDGYQFDGWYTDVNCTDKYDFNTVVSADLTLYAKWLAKYTVSFDTDGGSTVESQTVVTGNKATKPTSTPTKKGYNFVGWYTDNTCTTEFDFENTSITDNTTIYAKFEDASIFKLDGYTFNKISTLEELTTGYYVIGGFDGTNYAYMNDILDKKGFFGVGDKPSVHFTFYNKAGKVKIQKSQNEYLSAVGGSPKNFGIVDNRKDAYEFVPQMIDDELQIRLTEARGSNVIAYNKDYSRIKPYASISTSTLNITLFKAQNVKPFYVTFKGPNNEELNKEEMLPHQKAPEFEAPNKPGHKFMGWYNEATDAKYDFTTELSEETVLVAKYEALTPAELFEQLEIKNQLAYHWQTEDGTTYKIDNVSLRFGVNLTEEMKSLEGVKFGAILAKKVDVANINLSEYARECTSAAEVVAGDSNLKYLEFTNIAAEGGMTSLRLDNLDSALAEEFVVVIYMEYNGKLYVTEQKIASVKVIASEYLNKKVDLDLTDDQIKSLEQLSK